MARATISDSISADQSAIEASLANLLNCQTTSVGRAMRYAVLGPGQRLRPMLSLRVARSLGCDSVLTLRTAGAVELLHCASLIVDDLPCMDDDSIRRNRAAVHIEFGEAIAVLAAFALVALAAKQVADQTRFQLKLLSMLDCKALVGGQALDLELCGEERERARSYVTSLKTVPLFELAAEAGSLSPRLTKEQRLAARAFGREYGVAYQMVDDYLDRELDDETQVEEQLARTQDKLNSFGACREPLEDLLLYLEHKFQNAQKHTNNRCHR